MYILPKISFKTNIYKPALADVIGSDRYVLDSAWNWKLYLEVLEAMMPVFFATNHYQSSKWFTIHIHEMKVVVGTAPEVYDEFMAGILVVQRTKRPFSIVSTDTIRTDLEQIGDDHRWIVWQIKLW